MVRRPLLVGSNCARACFEQRGQSPWTGQHRFPPRQPANLTYGVSKHRPFPPARWNTLYLRTKVQMGETTLVLYLLSSIATQLPQRLRGQAYSLIKHIAAILGLLHIDSCRCFISRGVSQRNKQRLLLLLLRYVTTVHASWYFKRARSCFSSTKRASPRLR